MGNTDITKRFKICNIIWKNDESVENFIVVSFDTGEEANEWIVDKSKESPEESYFIVDSQMCTFVINDDNSIDIMSYAEEY